MPGLFLAGSALVRYGVVERMERSTPVPAMLGLVFAAGAAPGLWLQLQTGEPDSWVFRSLVAVAGLLLAGVYVCIVLILLRTPLRPALHAVFAPLGRLALTNYLTATVLVLAAGRLLDRSDGWSSTRILLVAGVILAAQWLCSVLWLRRYRYGPLEWLWRRATWGAPAAGGRTSS